jgi:amidase
MASGEGEQKEILAAVMGTTGAAKPGSDAAKPEAADDGKFKIHGKSVAELQAAMADGTTSSRALTEHFIRRIYSIDQAGPRLQCVLEINPDALATADKMDAERAAGSTRGTLHGIPVLVKDNVDTGDLMHSTSGSRALMESQPGGDAHIITNLRAQGAVLLGKTNLSEWANFRGRSVSRWGPCYLASRRGCADDGGHFPNV